MEENIEQRLYTELRWLYTTTREDITIAPNDTVSVSYVGKAEFGESERYVRDFSLWTSTATNGMTIEISAVNGRFTLDFIQVFSSPVFVDAFLRELEENEIEYDLQSVHELELSNILLPWTE
jgi:hypothetical protein